ncbi:fibrillin-1-like [Ceratina calcarata]|uniref:Fibrillin-1-like n=1 Tax=Ceratina calcarata TaxID=156304 RepID=A0AAJ7JGI1_9HYME|nr:fibrillin-1-like [Ceratina calcarata]
MNVLRGMFFVWFFIHMVFSGQNPGAEARMEERFEKCCGLGTSWALEGLGCEKFTGPVPGVPQLEQGLCLEAVDICCVRTYHEQQCKKGKADARAGAACVTATSVKSRRLAGPGDYHRDCCEACKLGILTGSMGQGCAFKKFTFGNPWDPAFLECCHEASPSTTTNFPTNASSPVNETTDTESSTTNSSDTSFSPMIPTPPLDDICQLMRGLLCSDICVPTPGSYYCKCRDGFTLLEDGKTCSQDLPTDRCKSSNPCEQRCTDNGVAVTCSCDPGYVLADDARSCILKSTEMRTTVPDSDDFSPVCPVGYRYNAGSQVCDDVNECTEKESLCPDSCVNTVGSYLCQTKDNLKLAYEDCPPGYQWEPAAGLCTDVDECVILSEPCPVSRNFCVNTQGSFSCLKMPGIKSCPAGFKFDNLSQQCEDVNECEEQIDSCVNATETCRNTEGAYECDIKCEQGFVYNANLAACIGDQIESTESCERGYKKNPSTNKCVDINECLVGPGCRDHEKCLNTPGSFRCSPLCTSGWYYNPATKGCQDVDECLLGRHSCPDTHMCVNTNGSFVCEPIPPCENGFKRAQDGACVDIDECSENLHNCLLELHQYCVNGNGSFECITRLPDCQPGYQYSLKARACEDVDECAIGRYKCDSRLEEKCVNLPGSYKCERPMAIQQARSKPACPSGFRYHPRFRKCTDIDECAEGLDSCGTEICYNQPGGYSCSKPLKPITRRPLTTTTTPLPLPTNKKCPPGTKYVANHCVDVDECRELEDACTSNENCINTMGSYVCECRIGFRRENLTQACVDINECQTQADSCSNGQRCDNTIGSYTCTRYLSCGTGYTLNAATEICEDDDECLLGTHDCGPGYHCRNTLGSYRCDRNSRVPVPLPRLALVTTSTTTTTTTSTTLAPVTQEQINQTVTQSQVFGCIRGFEPNSNNKCVDIDECQRNPNACGRTMRCMNTIGSYRCVSKVICGIGYTLDPVSGQYCVDVDECANGTHECAPNQTCENRIGGYVCICPSGHVPGPNRDCVDIDECSLYGNICGLNSKCENTIGSYRCICENGFENVGNSPGGSCQDVDECKITPGLCQHACYNVWGSFRCGCKPGFRLNADNRSCTDVDECTEFKDNRLCIGICENTPGSYACKCPDGYKLGLNGRTCEEIDECKAVNPVCRDPDEICHNTRGSFRCNRINCPPGYHREHEKKNRCVKTYPCLIDDLPCRRQPSHYSYNFISLVSMLPIAPGRPEDLFKMKGYHSPGSTMQFTMALLEARAPAGVQRATESCFTLRRPAPLQAVLAMTRPIQGPQEIELELTMEIYHGPMFAGSAVAKLLIFVSQYEF